MKRSGRSRDVDTIRAALRSHGLRVTSSRVEALAVLRESTTPMSHAELYASLGTSSSVRSRIHRNLEAFAAAGLVRRMDLGDHVWRYDASSKRDEAGARFVCTACGSLQHLDVELVTARGRRARVFGGRVDIVVRGCCDSCA